ncbi:MAG TPA: transposase, partial [Planctomycetaceae bacterium]|nr:transposase [Planctomycetaceae bacterium]
MPVPQYDPRTAEGAFQLRYSWAGWPSDSTFATQPVELIEQTKPHWETDGLRILESRWTADLVQILFSARRDVSPVFVASRAKGRLDHALRTAGFNVPFSRKVTLRSIGDNTRDDVEGYIERQVIKEHFVDPRWTAALAEFTVINKSVDLSQPTESARGRYWYNLHLVLVVDGRHRLSDLHVLRTLRDGCFKIATKKGHLLSRVSVMPDHLHLALRANPDESPNDVAFAYQNNLAFMANLGRLWQDSFYVGT